MTLLDLLRIVYRRWYIMVACATTLGVLVYLSPEAPPTYSSKMIINTGLVSGFNLDRNTGHKIDYNYTNYEIENIINVATSHNTLKKLSVRLLATVVTMENPDTLRILEPHRQEILEKLGEEVLSEIKKPSLPATEEAIEARIATNMADPVFEIINSKHPIIGINTLSSVVVRRLPGTDMLRMNYESIDPGMCQLTLKELADIVVENHRAVKRSQSTDVIEFFEKQLAKSAGKLRRSEDDLLGFMVRNRIINYYEQTRFVAGRKEALDKLYNEEARKLASVDSAIARLEYQMRDFENLPRLHRVIDDKRSRLAEVSTKLSMLELAPDPDELFPDSTMAEWQQLKLEAAALRNQIRQAVSETQTNVVSPEGMDMKYILERWLLQVIDMEETKARLDVIRMQQGEFMEIYNMYAPWGSTIKRIEREIDVNEREYLENLHSYNQAWLNRINAMMSANLKIVDPPMYPLDAKPSGKMMLVIVAFVIGLMLPLVVFVGLHLLDQSMKSVHKAEFKSGLRVVSAVPYLRGRGLRRLRPTDLRVAEKAMEQLAGAVFKNARYCGKAKPVIAIFSTRTGVGKTWLIEHFCAFMRRKGFQMERVTARNWLLRREEFDIYDGEKGFILVEIPALLDRAGWHELINDVDMSFLVVYARSVWTKADKRALDNIQEVSRQPLSLFINGIPIDNMEEIIGEVPKARSPWRRWLKRVVSLQFSGKALKNRRKRKARRTKP